MISACRYLSWRLFGASSCRLRVTGVADADSIETNLLPMRHYCYGDDSEKSQASMVSLSALRLLGNELLASARGY